MSAPSSQPDPAPKSPAGLGTQGVALVRRFAVAHPVALSGALGATFVYSAGVVGASFVAGAVTDRVVIPAHENGQTTVSAVAVAVAAIVGVATMRSLGVIGRRYIGNVFTRRNEMDLRRELADRYLDIELRNHREHPTGDLLSVFDNDAERAVEALGPLPISIGTIMIALIALVSLVLVDPLIALIALAMIPSLVLLNRVFSARIEKPARASQALLGNVAAVAHESIDGVQVVKALGLEAAEVARFGAAAAEYRDARVATHAVRAFFDPALDLVPTVTSIAVVAVGAWRVSTGLITTGEFVQAVTLFGLLVFPMRVLGYFLESVPLSVIALDRVDAALHRGAPLRPAGSATLAAGPLSLEVVGVSHELGGERVLDDVSFSVAPGEIVALVGATGSGKSTLCELVGRLSDPTHGCIRVGGTNVVDLDPAVLHRRVGLALQESYLFAGTIGTNVALDDETIDAAEITAALEAARANFVVQLPNGLDTVVGERGVTLSGGQRQRVALARALARKPGLLILDDATSAVDPVIEAQILDGLRVARGARSGQAASATTLVIVAHRLSTIRLADRVLFLDRGRLVASGHHEDLLELAGYAELARAYEAADRR